MEGSNGCPSNDKLCPNPAFQFLNLLRCRCSEATDKYLQFDFFGYDFASSIFKAKTFLIKVWDRAHAFLPTRIWKTRDFLRVAAKHQLNAVTFDMCQKRPQGFKSR